MDLFKSVEKHLESVNVSIAITKNGDKISVSFLPQLKCSDDAKSQIVPLMLKGTAEELDAEFISVISTPLQKVSGISSNLIQYEREVKKMEANTKLAEEEKKKTAEADKKALKKLEVAQKWFEKEDYKKAGKYTVEALKLSVSNSECLKMLKAINEKDPTLGFEVPEIKEDVEIKAEKSVEKVVEKIVKDDKSETVDEIKDKTPVNSDFTDFDNIDDLPINKITEEPKIVKSKEELDIECNNLINKALPLAQSKKFIEAKEVLEEALEIQPQHQRANIAYKKVLQWIEANKPKEEENPFENKQKIVIPQEVKTSSQLKEEAFNAESRIINKPQEEEDEF